MATDRRAVFAIPAAAALLLWPALWNGYPIVFADTGTYLSQAIHRYAGWDRPVFYSLFMLPLHATVTLWPVVVVQALLTAWVLWLVCRVLMPDVSGFTFVGGVAILSACTWLPWIVSELMPDLFTPLLVLVLCLLAWVPEFLSRREQVVLVGFATFMIASQQSSLPLACVLLAVLAAARRRFDCPVGSGAVRVPSFVSWPAKAGHPRLAVVDTPKSWMTGPSPIMTQGESPVMTQEESPVMTPGENRAGMIMPLPRHPSRPRIWLLIALPPTLAVLGLCTVNLAAHGRFAIAPFGNVFLLARVIADGPGIAVLRRDCPTMHWRLCPFLDDIPPTSDDFLWMRDSPLNLAGGPKAVSQDANAIVTAALIADPMGEARAALTNTLRQLARFDSGDGLTPWPTQVSPWIERDFSAREHAAYASARQQTGRLSVPPAMAHIHMIAALAGVIACAILLPAACKRRSACAGFLLAVLLALPVSAAITGSLSAPHDRYQARIMWLPPFIAVLSLASLRRRFA